MPSQTLFFRNTAAGHRVFRLEKRSWWGLTMKWGAVLPGVASADCPVEGADVPVQPDMVTALHPSAWGSAPAPVSLAAGKRVTTRSWSGPRVSWGHGRGSAAQGQPRAGRQGPQTVRRRENALSRGRPAGNRKRPPAWPPRARARAWLCRALSAASAGWTPLETGQVSMAPCVCESKCNKYAG